MKQEKVKVAVSLIGIATYESRKEAYCKMKSMMFASKSLLLFAKVVVMAFTWRNTKCEHASPT